MKRWGLAAVVVVASGLVLGCGGEAGDEASAPGGSAGEAADAGAAAGAGALTAEEMENGVGPVRSVELGELDEALAERGEELFGTMCYACHRLEERYVAPQLGNVLERRTPEYVMNMILNPAGMTERHPTARELLAEYMTQMPNQGLSEEEARAIVEYIRSEAVTEGEAGGENDQPGR